MERQINIGHGKFVSKNTYEARKRAAELNYRKIVSDAVIFYTLRSMLDAGMTEAGITNRAKVVIEQHGEQIAMQGV